ncbi:phosphoribosylaminoimidazolesuccinocarboxamide synthase [Thermospira aquatica]|uniref:Phosphoribosylaminoimidazole-succinocarboxamide synthase n=1 Tax=Thermospira aquatica TaxID=2828656 RepID=A0AAX3BB78_9SPIR|nr:phosphoribosylaminoimidazolesuccinocarboxamide synthase [Thermospira aquatica]URA09531.1 phosphoribosylaminoimidazolesuccinocarboxamide synthase [Thermospira aquatica]
MTITQSAISFLPLIYQGKVRDIYAISDEEWLMVTTDRISAFDVVFNEGIPEKGRILNHISLLWFDIINFIPNAIITREITKKLPQLADMPGIPERSMIVRKLKRLPFECVVRGYLFGSVYEEYQKTGSVAGHKLPSDLPLAGKLPTPIFTPATKEDTGHDINITVGEFEHQLGDTNLARQVQEISLSLYSMAYEKLLPHGIILADTKFEFGLDDHNRLILIDEVLTPDSSRYWDQATYKEGKSPASYDKQFLRDYLTAIKWNKKPPAPPLPEDIITKTHEKYKTIETIIEKVCRE